MTILSQAIEAAEARKAALFGDHDGLTAANFSTSDQVRALLSGFDIDYAELRAASRQVGEFFGAMALHANLIYTHESAWAEGLLIGLLAGTLPHDEPN